MVEELISKIEKLRTLYVFGGFQPLFKLFNYFLLVGSFLVTYLVNKPGDLVNSVNCAY